MMNTVARPVHVGLAGRTDPDSVFAFQQMHFAGDLPGLMKNGLVARRLKDLTDEERAELEEKKRRNIRYGAFEQKSEILSEYIEKLTDHIDIRTDEINDEIKTLHAQKTQKSRAEIKRLKEEKRLLKEKRKELMRLNIERLRAVSMGALKAVEYSAMTVFKTLEPLLEKGGKVFRTLMNKLPALSP